VKRRQVVLIFKVSSEAVAYKICAVVPQARLCLVCSYASIAEDSSLEGRAKARSLDQ